jgi:redox-sensitive bicupin YhaK (pirin superfamily)
MAHLQKQYFTPVLHQCLFMLKTIIMEKKIVKIDGGANSTVGDFLVNRLLPFDGVQAVGPLVFLDHIYPVRLTTTAATVPTGEYAHPHRGMATFSYVMNGNMTHYDSRGNHNTIGAGGVQWMKAGNGILHDEQPFVTEDSGELFQSLQFWINLPAKNKAEPPEYMALQAHEVTEITLPAHSGVLRVLLGELGCAGSPIKTFSRQFIYHIKLNPKSTYVLDTRPQLEYAAFVPGAELSVNGRRIGKSKIAIFDGEGDRIVLENANIQPADVFIFGGEPYTEPIVSRGPFVMNSHAEVAAAYRDFFEGRYGTVSYTGK